MFNVMCITKHSTGHQKKTYMKTEREIQKVIDWLDFYNSDVSDPYDDLPYIENIRDVQEILKWVIKK